MGELHPSEAAFLGEPVDQPFEGRAGQTIVPSVAFTVRIQRKLLRMFVWLFWKQYAQINTYILVSYVPGTRCMLNQCLVFYTAVLFYTAVPIQSWLDVVRTAISSGGPEIPLAVAQYQHMLAATHDGMA